MFKNATIEFGKREKKGFDENRNPIPSEYLFSEPIRCTMVEIKDNNQQNTEGGKFQKLLWRVFVSFSDTFDIASEKAKLEDDVVGDLGEFFVTSVVALKPAKLFKVELSQWQQNQ